VAVFLTIGIGESARTAVPLIESSNRRLIAAVGRLIRVHLDDDDRVLALPRVLRRRVRQTAAQSPS
jgi:hypothetical protein